MIDKRIEAYYTRYDLGRFVPTEQIECLRLCHFASGQSICEYEQQINQLFFFVEGHAKVLFPAQNGRQLLLCFYKPLQLFGDVELFDDTPRANTTVQAITECTCLGLDRAFVVEHLADNPVFLRYVCSALGGKLQRVIRNGALNTLHPLESRVASYIVATATLNEEQQLMFAGNLTQIADMLGTSFRHLHRTLQALCGEGILAKEGVRYRIQQLRELERRAADTYIIV